MRPLPFLACVETDFARVAAPVRPRLRSKECLSALRQIAFAAEFRHLRPRPLGPCAAATSTAQGDRSWKRRTQPRNTYSALAPLLLGCHQLLGWEPLRGNGCQERSGRSTTPLVRESARAIGFGRSRSCRHIQTTNEARLTVLIAANKSKAGLFDNIIKLYYPRTA
jgi:hypothetical protein